MIIYSKYQNVLAGYSIISYIRIILWFFHWFPDDFFFYKIKSGLKYWIYEIVFRFTVLLICCWSQAILTYNKLNRILRKRICMWNFVNIHESIWSLPLSHSLIQTNSPSKQFLVRYLLGDLRCWYFYCIPTNCLFWQPQIRQFIETII